MAHNQTYRFSLDKSSRKYICPNCNRKSFVRYIDYQVNKTLHLDCGRCDREHKCGYHFPPKSLFSSCPDLQPIDRTKYTQVVEHENPINYIPYTFIEKTLKHYSKNGFVKYLLKYFTVQQVEVAIDLYRIGTAKMWNGSTVFWQEDINGRVRQGKVIKYDPQTGKRNKKLGCLFIGKKIMKNEGVSRPNLKQTFFGSHLLGNDDGKFVGMVESEKTAIILFLLSLNNVVPDYHYIATGGKSGCKWYESSVHQVLSEKNLIIIPDLGAEQDWIEKSKFIKAKSVVVANILREIANDTQVSNGLDIADFFDLSTISIATHAEEKTNLIVKGQREIDLENMISTNPSLSHFITQMNLRLIE